MCLQSMETLIMDTMHKKVFHFFFHFTLGMCIYRYRLCVHVYAYIALVYNVQCAQYTNTLLLQYFITVRGPFFAKRFSAISINFIFQATCNICPTTLQPFSKSRYSLNLLFLHYHLSCLCSQVYVLGLKNILYT